MDEYKVFGGFSSSGATKRLLLIVLTTTLLSAGWATSRSIEKASANNINFCTNAFLEPKGKPGSECGASSGGLILDVFGEGVEHSMCVAYIGGANENLSGWNCTAGPGGSKLLWAPNDGVWKRGDLRNNTTGGKTHVQGSWGCCF